MSYPRRFFPQRLSGFGKTSSSRKGFLLRAALPAQKGSKACPRDDGKYRPLTVPLTRRECCSPYFLFVVFNDVWGWR